jgi:hypothetical protein
MQGRQWRARAAAVCVWGDALGDYSLHCPKGAWSLVGFMICIYANGRVLYHRA